MMRVRPTENILGALWKSAVTEVLARQAGASTTAPGQDISNSVLEGTERYLDALDHGRALKAPAGRSDTDPDVAAYLAQLHHQLACANLNNDPALQASITAQLQQYKYGNPLWQQMLVQYFEYYAQYPYHHGGKPKYRSWQAPEFGKGDPQYAVIPWRLPAKARIAIVGDIGTGTDDAAAVLVAALSFRPDAILHVGDVYYSGTTFEVEHRFVGLFESVFKAQKFRAPVFTVPGNHEYFVGAGPFLKCIDSGRLATSPDQHQSASYFCLRTEDNAWQFLGMDTGFYGHTMAVTPAAEQAALQILHGRDPAVPLSPPAPPTTAQAKLPVELPAPSGDPVVSLRDDEVAWHQQKLDQFAGRSILLSHHQLYSAVQVCGVAQATVTGADGKAAPDAKDFNRIWVNTKIWRQIGKNFGSRVAAWFWGHEHNLGIYQDAYRPADWPTDGDNIFRTLPKGRCVGHSAIPVAQTENPYAQTYPVPLKDAKYQLGLTAGWYNRGFQILELAGGSNASTVRYFQVVGVDPKPGLVYQEQII